MNDLIIWQIVFSHTSEGAVPERRIDSVSLLSLFELKGASLEFLYLIPHLL